jgi:hypothetical protein
MTPVGALPNAAHAPDADVFVIDHVEQPSEN